MRSPFRRLLSVLTSSGFDLTEAKNTVIAYHVREPHGPLRDQHDAVAEGFAQLGEDLYCTASSFSQRESSPEGTTRDTTTATSDSASVTTRSWSSGSTEDLELSSISTPDASPVCKQAPDIPTPSALKLSPPALKLSPPDEQSTESFLGDIPDEMASVMNMSYRVLPTASGMSLGSTNFTDAVSRITVRSTRTPARPVALTPSSSPVCGDAFKYVSLGISGIPLFKFFTPRDDTSFWKAEQLEQWLDAQLAAAEAGSTKQEEEDTSSSGKLPSGVLVEGVPEPPRLKLQVDVANVIGEEELATQTKMNASKAAEDAGSQPAINTESPKDAEVDAQDEAPVSSKSDTAIDKLCKATSTEEPEPQPASNGEPEALREASPDGPSDTPEDSKSGSPLKWVAGVGFLSGEAMAGLKASAGLSEKKMTQLKESGVPMDPSGPGQPAPSRAAEKSPCKKKKKKGPPAGANRRFVGGITISSRDYALKYAKMAEDARHRMKDATFGPHHLALWTDGSWGQPTQNAGFSVVFRRSQADIESKYAGACSDPWQDCAYTVSSSLRGRNSYMELLAVECALAIAVKVVEERECIKKVTIFTDSHSSLQMIQSGHGRCFSRGAASSRTLKQQGVELELYWCPGHAGIEGNARADRVAALARVFGPDPAEHGEPIGRAEPIVYRVPVEYLEDMQSRYKPLAQLCVVNKTLSAELKDKEKVTKQRLARMIKKEEWVIDLNDEEDGFPGW
ncbi:hypothetical protein OQA88_10183 [Cercophora sp. LCS_1]